MGLETGEFIPELIDTNPVTATDPVTEGSNHLRLIKRCLQGSFPAFVGTQAVPKSVILTEDEINDLPVEIGNNTLAILINAADIVTINSTAAFVADDELITGEWTFGLQTNFLEQTLMANNRAYRAFQLNGTTAVRCLQVNVTDEVDIGSPNNNANVHGNGQIQQLINSVVVGNFRPRANGSLLINDMGGVAKKAGFRNPSNQQIGAGAVTLVQANESQILRSINTQTLTLPVLEAGTQIDLLTSDGITVTLAESSTFIRSPDGSGASLQGNRTIAGGSIIHMNWRTVSTIDVWGNGIS